MGAPDQLLLATTSGGRLFAGAVDAATVPAFTVALMVVLAVAATRTGRSGRSERAVVTTDLAGGGMRFEALAPPDTGAPMHARLDLPLRSLRVCEWVTGSAEVAADDCLRASLGRRRPVGGIELLIGDGEEPVAQARPALTTAPGLDPVADLSRGQATSLLRMLPRGAGDTTVWALPTARSLLLGAAAHPEAVCVPGAARLTVLRPLVRHATGLRVLTTVLGSPGAASAWELTTPGLRLTITLNGLRPAAPQPWTLAKTTTLSR